VRRDHATVRLGHSTHKVSYHHFFFGAFIMSWTKPEAEVVAVTMEVTAYVATL
jgi:hypothetical protein